MAFEMNEIQEALFDKLMPLQKEIALNSFSGMNDIDAYRNSKGKARTESAQRASVCEILANPNVVAFIDSMKPEAISDAVMSRQEMLEALSIIADMTGANKSQTTAGALCELKDGYGVKLKAMKQLAELNGYNSAIKSETTIITKADDSDW